MLNPQDFSVSVFISSWQSFTVVFYSNPWELNTHHPLPATLNLTVGTTSILSTGIPHLRAGVGWLAGWISVVLQCGPITSGPCYVRNLSKQKRVHQTWVYIQVFSSWSEQIRLKTRPSNWIRILKTSWRGKMVSCWGFSRWNTIPN